MTIIEPKKIKSRSKFVILPILAIVIVSSLAVIALYNKTVDFRFRLTEQEKELENLKVLNAELKNKVYSYLDTEVLSNTARELGLVLEKKPVYLETESDELVTNL